MQTRIPAPAEANKQQSHSAQHPAQLLAEQQSAFEDHRPQAAQLTSLQAKMNGSAQAQQMRTLQTQISGGDVAQRESLEEPLQAQVDGGAVQREEAATAAEAPKPNNTGLPDNLKSGIESLSGMSMDHVKVHYNSSQPAQLNAHAYAQGSEIHVAPGQEQHVPHEAWHVVQQAQGRVRPTMQMKMGVPVNDDVGLEIEADVMGKQAMGLSTTAAQHQTQAATVATQAKLIQCYTLGTGTTRSVTVTGSASKSRTFEECTYNAVEYKLGDTIASSGTATASPAGWATWLTNKKGGNNATQLHVVNKRWGGLGGVSDKNIVPGTPAENSHHLHEAEKKFDLACFGMESPPAGTKAIQDAKYECTATPSYGTAVNVATGAIDTADPTISVTITAASGGGTFPVTTGTDGLTFKDGT